MQPASEAIELVGLLWQGEDSSSPDRTATTEPGENRLVLGNGIVRIAMRTRVLVETSMGEVTEASYSLMVIDRQGSPGLGSGVEYHEKDFPLLAQLYDRVGSRINQRAVAGVLGEIKEMLRRRKEGPASRPPGFRQGTPADVK